MKRRAMLKKNGIQTDLMTDRAAKRRIVVAMRYATQNVTSSFSLRHAVVGGVSMMFFGLHAAEVTHPTFNRHIRPILSENCFHCHGQDPQHRGGNLRLDVREEALKGGDNGPAFVVGNAAKSAMIQRILSTDPDEVMPPPKAHMTVKSDQLRTLQRWIDQGAVYEKHWAFETPVKLALPDSQTNPIDFFVQQRLREEGLSPSPRADDATLLRRLYLDLTGLPPAAAETQAFLADRDPQRWQRWIERTMESPHFAERLAMPWLDAARYADTNGFSIDDHRDMWGWRDWVITAFQQNMPYDRFLIEQIAGDLLPEATISQRVATGFLRNSMNTHEGGTIAEEYRVAHTIDKVDTVASTTLGLTMKCAQCHNHKFDPISQKEYYQFFAFFNTSSEPGKGETNGNTPPLVEFASPLPNSMAQLQRRVSELEQLICHPTPAIVSARDAWVEEQLRQPATISAPAAFPWDQLNLDATEWIWHKQALDQQAIEVEREFEVVGTAQEAWLLLSCDNNGTARLNDASIARNPDWREPTLVDVRTSLRNGKNQLRIQAFNMGDKGGVLAILAWKDQQGQWQSISTDGEWQSRDKADSPWIKATSQGKWGQLPWGDLKARLAAAPKYPLLRRIMETPAPQRQPSDWLELNRAFANSDAADATMMQHLLASLNEEIRVLKRDITRGKTTVMVMDHKPELRKTHVLTRGAYDQPGEEVQPGTPQVLPPLGAGASATRLDLARWLTLPENPLPARVMVNRLWEMIFGLGIVESTEDFGNQGAWPTHPELLDWLAVDFVEHQWDIRHVIKTILLSDTYQQSAVCSSEALSKDPRNQLLSRSPRPRLAAEIIRDQALSVSGLLQHDIGGPSVHPLQPELWRDISHFGHPTVFTAQHNYPGTGASNARRSIYTFWKRTMPPPALSLFDAPTRETCSLRRNRTNTPLQALVLMNDPQYVTMGAALGKRMQTEGGSNITDRVTYGFRLCTGREPSATEIATLTHALTRFEQRYQNDAAAAYALFGSMLLNLDETITRP